MRDEKLGILKKLVRAGLRQAVIGLERDDAGGLAALGKHHNDAEVCREAVAILREKHPEVYIIGSLIFGLPGDTWADLNRLMAWQDRLGPDYCLIIPLTPNPGTTVAQEFVGAGGARDADLAHYNFHTPVCATQTLDLPTLRGMYWRTLLRPSWRRIQWALRTMLFERDARKRRITRSLLRHSTNIATECLRDTWLGTRSAQVTCYSRKPSWYET